MTYPLPCPMCGHPGTDVRIYTDFRIGSIAVHCNGCGFIAKSVEGQHLHSPIEVWNACVTARMAEQRDGKEVGQ